MHVLFTARKMANTAFYQRVQVHSPNTHTRHSALLLWLRFDVTFFIFHTRSRLIRMHLFTHTHTHTYGNIVVVIVVYTGTLPVVVYKCVCECISECMCVWISLKKEFCRYFVYSASTKNQTTYLYTSKCMYMCTYVHTQLRQCDNNRGKKNKNFKLCTFITSHFSIFLIIVWR